ncbi:2'-5' RNA ligase family protein, partial [Streptomyces sparsus]
GHFGDRALWAGVDGDRDRLAALAADAAEAGRRTLHAALPATHLSAPDPPATGAPAATGRSVSDPPPGRYVPSPGGPEGSVSQGSVSQGGEGRPDVHRSGTAWSFVPHLTLARGPGGVPLTPWAAELDGFASQSWQVTEVALVSSRLPRGPVAGPRYLRVAAWPLGG